MASINTSHEYALAAEFVLRIVIIKWMTPNCAVNETSCLLESQLRERIKGMKVLAESFLQNHHDAVIRQRRRT